MRFSVDEKDSSPNQILDEAYRSVGDVLGARSVGQLPRGPANLYDARHAAKKARLHAAETGSDTNKEVQSCKYDELWTLLERAKREEEISKDETFIRSCEIHPSLSVVLASERQLQHMVQFCTNPQEFSVLGVDPTFNIFDTNLSLTVTTYRNLRLQQKETGKPPVFIGPLLIHQRKTWQAYSAFANRLTLEKPELDGVLACGTDGEEALIDGFRRNFRYATFLRCFIHFKDNILRELTRRGLSPKDKSLYINEIFGTIQGTVKLCGLVDCDTRDEFIGKFESLKTVWEEREASSQTASGIAFFEWFRKEKVRFDQFNTTCGGE